MWTKFINYTVNQISKSALQREPYWHFAIDDFMHPGLLHLCNTNWPDIGDIKNPPGYNQNRLGYDTDSSFWREFETIYMGSEKIKRMIFLKGEIWRDLETTTSLALWEDSKGYSVSYHKDNLLIYIAAQIFISNDERLRPYGTEMVGPPKEFKFYKRFECKENFAWLMINDANSWHGMKTEIKEDVKRRSIMFRYINKIRAEEKEMPAPYIR
tara:strand:- start:47 stop:682 length:636 start_codon:yes stop_codon:yes gene_type:complete